MFRKNKIAFLLVVLVLFFSIHGVVFCQTGNEEKNITPEEWKKKVRPKSTWEHILSFPGKVIFLPFQLIFDGTTHLITVFDETKFIPRVHDFLTSDDGTRGLLPTYESRTGPGIKIYQRGIFNTESKLTLTMTAWTHQRQFYGLEFKRVRFLNNMALFSIYYQSLPNELFFGIGNDSKFDSESIYAHKKIVAEMNWNLNIGQNFDLIFLAGFEQNQISDGRGRDEPPISKSFHGIPGLTEKIQFGRLQFQISNDSRDRPGNPTSGGENKISGGIFKDIKNDQFSFWEASFDFNRHIHLFYNRTIVFRMAGRKTEKLHGGNIPFYYQSELGERTTIRGFQRGRFRDFDMFLTTAEYRYPISTKAESGIEALLYVDGGQVSNDIVNNFSLQEFHVGFGGGFRFYGAEGTIACIEVGKSIDGFRFYFVLN